LESLRDTGHLPLKSGGKAHQEKGSLSRGRKIKRGKKTALGRRKRRAARDTYEEPPALRGTDSGRQLIRRKFKGGKEIRRARQDPPRRANVSKKSAMTGADKLNRTFVYREGNLTKGRRNSKAAMTRSLRRPQ